MEQEKSEKDKKETKNLESKITDDECLFNRIKKENVANHIDTLYSQALAFQCENCDGYKLNCPHYINAQEYKMFKGMYKVSEE